jgi:hypothetical protein
LLRGGLDGLSARRSVWFLTDKALPEQKAEQHQQTDHEHIHPNLLEQSAGFASGLFWAGFILIDINVHFYLRSFLVDADTGKSTTERLRNSPKRHREHRDYLGKCYR